MKKVVILGAANLKHMTLITLYTAILKQNNIDYDVIYLDRYGEQENNDAKNSYKFNLKINPKWHFFRKLFHYWKFKKFAINIIKKNKYDFIIVWNEFTMFMFSNFLIKNYPKKYCVNIRDQNFNNIFFVNYRYKKVINNSCFATISSKKFLEVYPKYDYLFVHSYNKEIIDNLHISKKNDMSKPLKLVFVGRVSYPDTMFKVIKAIGNDNRFIFDIAGEGALQFENFIKKNKYLNINIRGRFEPEETAGIIDNADIIYSLNKENDVHSDTLLPIKLYYAIAKHIPIMTFKTSYTYEFANDYNIAIGVTSNDFDRLGDEIIKQYSLLNQSNIDNGCKKAIKNIEESHKTLFEYIFKYIV